MKYSLFTFDTKFAGHKDENGIKTLEGSLVTAVNWF